MPYRAIVARALALGVAGFDTSPYYGPAEVLLGDALQTAAAPRASYALATKAGRVAGDEFDYSPAYIRHSVLRSLRRLHAEYLDLVYLHDVEFVSAAEVLAAVGALRRLRDEGKVRAVGISGFPVHLLCDRAEEVLRATGEPLDAVLSYGHFTIQNPVLAEAEVVRGDARPAPEDGPLARFRRAGVQVVLNASMLGMGILTQAGVPESTTAATDDAKAAQIAKWHPSPDALRRACREMAATAARAGDRLETVAIRWAMEEYARAAAAAGLGVALPDGTSVGATVMGVTTVAELEQTAREWGEVLAGLEGSSPRRDALKAMVEGDMWPALGEWKGYAWASPGEGFVNTRGDRMGQVSEEDELLRDFEERVKQA
jgi:aryl-alcohol dehydrogenase-like predicted oxidoreductase